MAIPKRNRDDLSVGAELVLTLDYRAECLLLYQKPEWELVIHDLKDKPREHPVYKQIFRTMVAYAMECSPDKTGRLLLPQEHRIAAEIDQSIMLVGQFNKFEIWDTQRWEKEQARLQESYAQEVHSNIDEWAKVKM